ncbi:MAG TPA: DEAD/DEAH box helicase [Candidatus Ozemobacteraceae bacterium]|nr:DEAD/DEAH box helicase [Candidatus Ozemobacteraceae bacterium]
MTPIVRSPQSVPPTPAPQPATFASFNLHPDLMRGIEQLGFETPTEVQRNSIPVALSGRDLLACAMTGSGKTAAFLLPIMHGILTRRQAQKPEGFGHRSVTRALILTPTRELAAQIHEHMIELARFTTLRGAAVFGGVGMEPQTNAFRTGVDIIIATPGRLLDHFTYPHGKLPHLEYLVLDEADRMLDMGFLPDIRRVLAQLPQTPRQTLFYSATMPEPIVTLSQDMLRNPVAINIRNTTTPATGIKHAAYTVPENLKQHLLVEVFKHEAIRSAIVFTRTKHRADRLAAYLNQNGIACLAIHSNRSQTRRTEALGSFKNGQCPVLVATDIAARGIDVEALSHVVNFDVPHLAEDYVHRVGRTARASLKGTAITLVAPHEEIDFCMIEKKISKKIQRRQVEGFNYRAPGEPLEIPLGQRIAAIRARKADERARSAAKARAKAEREALSAQQAKRTQRSSLSTLSTRTSQVSATREQPTRRQTQGGSHHPSTRSAASDRSIPIWVDSTDAQNPRQQPSSSPRSSQPRDTNRGSSQEGRPANRGGHHHRRRS